MARFLKGAGWKIERHHEYFPDEADDEVIIQEVTKREWVLLSADKRIERESLHAVVVHKAKVILLSDNNSGWRHWSAALVAAQDQIGKALNESDGPLVIRVSKAGHVNSVRLSEDLAALDAAIETKKIARSKKAGMYDRRQRLAAQGKLFTEGV